MHRLRSWVETYYLRIVSSIAFWPSILAAVGIGLAWLLRRLPRDFLEGPARELLPMLYLSDASVALSILTTLIGGLISLMVFSFSMVMVLLSNATNNLSPRLLPSLIGSRRHQLVLGTYLGSILYCIVVALGYGYDAEAGTPPGIAVGLAVVFGIACLALFVAFIHGVSRSIQIGVVLGEVHGRTVAAVEGLAGRLGVPAPAQPGIPVAAREAGFFQGVDDGSLARWARDRDARVVVTAVRGTYVLPGEELMRVVGPVQLEPATIGELQELLVYGPYKRTERYYAHGLAHVVEVAQKALSPGINDPATARQAIDYLTDLLARTLVLGPYETVNDGDEQTRLWLRLEPWETLLERHALDLLTYGKTDPSVVASVARMLERLRVRSGDHAGRLEVIDRLRERVARLADEAAVV